MQYMAGDNENIEVLKGFFDDFEFTSYWDSFDDFDCEDDGAVKLDMHSLSAVPEETTAEELIPGIGIRNISVCLRYVFGGWESRDSGVVKKSRGRCGAVWDRFYAECKGFGFSGQAGGCAVYTGKAAAGCLPESDPLYCGWTNVQRGGELSASMQGTDLDVLIPEPVKQKSPAHS